MGGSKPTKKGELAMQYISEYPEWFPLAALARVMYQENPHSFDSTEDARFTIRYYKGEAGDKNRGRVIRAGNFFSDNFNRTSSPWVIPETWAEEKKVFQIPTGLKKIGFIADLQVPFHDPQAIDLCFNYLTKHEIDCLFINGDLVDFYGISEFEKDPCQRDFKQEYDATLEMLLYIKQSFPGIPIYYNLDANHEFRYERYMRKKAPELLKLKLFELEDLLKLSEIGIHALKKYDHIKIGKLACIHGDTTFRRGSGVSPARTLWMRTKVSCIASHVHRSSEYTDKNFYGEISTCWTTGMLMHPNVDYCRHVDQYNQGFAIIHKELNGDYEVENKKIYNGKVF